MTKVSIIDVSLDASIDDIISRDVAEITGKAKQTLDAAIAMQKAVQEQKAKKEAVKKAATNKVSAVLDQIYTTIEKAADEGISVEEAMRIAEGIIPNSSALTLRLKTFLRSKNNIYRLVRKNEGGVAKYYFEHFNKTEDD